MKGVQGAHGWPPEKCKERSACYFDRFRTELTAQYHLSMDYMSLDNIILLRNFAHWDSDFAQRG